MKTHKYGKIVYCIFYNTQNLGNIHQYFIDNSDEVFSYIYPSTGKNRPTIFRHFVNGNMTCEKEIFWYKGDAKLIIYLMYFVYYLYIFWYFKIRDASIIANFPFFAFFAWPLRILTNCTFVLEVGDYFPQKTGIIYWYNKILHLCIKISDHLIFSSQMIHDTYGKAITLRKNQLIRIITPGVTNVTINRNPQSNLLGFLGNIRHGQGLEIIFEFLQRNPAYYLELIGSGSLHTYYKELAEKLNLAKQIKFLGFVDDKDLLGILSKWQIAFAPYDPSPNNLTYYTEPSKIKLYIQYEIPVVMTKVTYMHNEMQKYKGGYVVDYDSSGIEFGVKSIQSDYGTFTNGIKELKRKYYFKDIYDKGFDFLQKKTN